MLGKGSFLGTAAPGEILSIRACLRGALRGRL